MKIFEYRDYREFMVELLHSMPKRGHGVLTQWAKALRVSIPLMSQILKGIKGMTHETADDLSRHLGLSEKEIDYFLLLVIAEPVAETQVQPASLDLRLGPVAYRVRASFLPKPAPFTTLAGSIQAFAISWPVRKLRMLKT